MQNNPELDLAFNFVQFTNKNIFLTGKAGTGKTTFLKSLTEKLDKRIIVVAPTGVAAINASGVTIHSFFQLNFGPILTENVTGKKITEKDSKQKFPKQKIKIIKSLELLIIDEISMVRADILDGIDEVLRRYKDRFLPFGGVQLLMIGDLQQLSPVVKNDEWNILKEYYSSMFFFHSKALAQAEMISIELTQVYRQKDETFLNILNEIRINKLTKESYDKLHQRYIPDFKPKLNDEYIILTTHNNSASKVNEGKLKEIKSKSHFFKATIQGEFPENFYPTDFNIELKIGAQVMFIKNDSSPEKRYFNGKIGKIIKFEKEHIIVKCLDEEIYVGQEVWQNLKYKLNEQTQEIEGENVGSFSQFPLRLAWAITIHKSQGLTFDKAIIDAGEAFAHGQSYVALSRCRTLDGLILASKLSEKSIISDKEVTSFNDEIDRNKPTENQLIEAKKQYQLDVISEMFDYKQLIFETRRLETTLINNKQVIEGNILDNIILQKTSFGEASNIAQKFIVQLQTIIAKTDNVETDENFQERIKKAAHYFHQFHLDNIIKTLNEITFETDNKAISTRIKDSISAINEVIKIKQACLKSCFNGFNLKEYQNTKVKASLTLLEKNTEKNVEYKDVETNHSELYSLLKYWRKEEAFEKEVEDYKILSHKILQQIANQLPTNVNQLLKIDGFGKVKAKYYGNEIIEIVKGYMFEKGIDAVEPELQNIKIPSHQKTFQLFKEGKSIAEISQTLDLATSTIEAHLKKYIINGEIDVLKIVDNDSLDEILQYFQLNPEALLGSAKLFFKEKYSYSTLGIVKSHFEYLQNL